MSLVFDQIQNIPQTHVFIIGIGEYPYLTGGIEADENSPLRDWGLGQLTSPPQSAKALYEKVLELDDRNSWVKPLGSVELLLSSQDELFPGQSIERATLENIKSSYYKWRERCESSKDNVAFFFFCGHGLEKDGHYLLAEDFGENLYNPWEGAFDFDNTRSAFQKCLAETQIFLVDACRQMTNDMFLQNITAMPLQNFHYMRGQCRNDLTIKSTVNSEAAYGGLDQPSVFVQILLKALDGQAAIRENGVWSISISSMHTTINKLIESDLQRPSFSGTDSIAIIQLPAIPLVDLEISCNPDIALTHARLSCRNLNSSYQNAREPAPDPWQINLEAGIYELGATFNDPPFKNTILNISVIPPFTREKLKCL